MHTHISGHLSETLQGLLGKTELMFKHAPLFVLPSVVELSTIIFSAPLMSF